MVFRLARNGNPPNNTHQAKIRTHIKLSTLCLTIYGYTKQIGLQTWLKKEQSWSSSIHLPCQFARGMDGVGDGHTVKAGGEANQDQQLHLWDSFLAAGGQLDSCARVIAHAHKSAEWTREGWRDLHVRRARYYSNDYWKFAESTFSRQKWLQAIKRLYQRARIAVWRKKECQRSPRSRR